MKKIDEFKVIYGPLGLIESIQAKQEPLDIIADLDKLSAVCGIEFAAYLAVINKLLLETEDKPFYLKHPLPNILTYQNHEINSRMEGILLEGKSLNDLLNLEDNQWFLKVIQINPNCIYLAPVLINDAKVTLSNFFIDLEDAGVCKTSILTSDTFMDYIDYIQRSTTGSDYQSP